MPELPSQAAGLLQLAIMRSGLTQAEVARRAGMAPEAVSAYVRDKRQPSLPQLQRLLRAAGFELVAHLAVYDPADHDTPIWTVPDEWANARVVA